MIKLYQFKFSHFCEKTRWALDYKGVNFKSENLLPGLHVKITKKLAPKTSLPILADGGSIVQDSTVIINYLDNKFPQKPLTPVNPELSDKALEWEEYLDDEVGVTLRLWFYFYALQDRDCALNFFLDGQPWYARRLFKTIFTKVKEAMIQSMNINEVSVKQSEQRFLSAFDKLDSRFSENGFLVGDCFSRADLTACALLSPLCTPGKSEDELSTPLPGQVLKFRESHKSRAFFKWVINMYDKCRYLTV